MATETSPATGTETEGTNEWVAGAIGGIVGGIVFGAMIQLSMPQIIGGAIPALWGLSGLVAGWLVHLVNSLILGLVYVAIAENTGLRGYAAEARSGWALGSAWGDRPLDRRCRHRHADLAVDGRVPGRSAAAEPQHADAAGPRRLRRRARAGVLGRARSVREARDREGRSVTWGRFS